MEGGGWIAMGHPVYAFKWLDLKYLANNNAIMIYGLFTVILYKK